MRGAKVFVDGKMLGKANTTIKVPKCSTELKVSARGFGDYTQGLSLKHQQKKRIGPLSKTGLRIEGPRGKRVRVQVDGKDVGRTPADVPYAG